MSDKTKYIIIMVALVVAFSCGRFLTPTKTITEVKTVTVEKVVYTQTRTKTTIRKSKDGTEDTVIISDTNTQDHTNSNSTDSTVTATGRKHLVNVTLLAGTTFAVLTPADKLISTNTFPIYGLSVTAPVFGPITLTGFGFSNLIFGGGVGINF